jgi:transcriptional regulator with GAF, ATPase, and Fis domain
MDESQRTRPHRLPAAVEIQRLSLTVTRGPSVGKHLRAEAGATVTVGSAEDNDLSLDDPTVSRYHLELVASGDGVLVRDLGSLNGTFLGATRLRDATVAAGAQLRVGDTVFVVSAAAETQPSEARLAIPGLVFQSAAMQRVAQAIHRLAAFGGSVLVQGETGTGKELVARALHSESPRSKGPFVVVDCGALPGNLVESELFGHERGAFTGAAQRHQGAFERAHGGTLFLDEIGELPAHVQPALLGVLQRKELRRVGGAKEVAVDVHVVSATHRDLRAEVNRGTFRADLYYRIAAARIVVPPLRERREDVLLLAEHFAREITGSEGALSAEALAVLPQQHWSGNVRELRNLVERTIAEGTGGEPGWPDAGEPSAPLTEAAAPPAERYRDARAHAVADFERRYLTALIEAAGGNASEAARRAQMDRPYLLSLLKKYGLR